MENRLYESQEIERLDLARYGLAYLEGSSILALSEPDLDKLLKALGQDDISLNIPIPCTPYNVQKILSYSECRNCGRCCIPNPLNPTNPGVEVFESELKAIAAHLGVTYDSWKEKTVSGKVVFHPFDSELDPSKLSFTRFLPLPCPFHDTEGKRCRIYPVRPIVCSIHPVVFTEDKSQIAIKANCDYGKDMIKAAFKDVRKKNPELVIKL
ncbi:MAG: YkgJ family cysteine cluster protein [Chloroflexi bacterium]|nr:YkgJ family cysteine cluster protein [Chloroflexota bacterium]